MLACAPQSSRVSIYGAVGFYSGDRDVAQFARERCVNRTARIGEKLTIAGLFLGPFTFLPRGRHGADGLLNEPIVSAFICQRKILINNDGKNREVAWLGCLGSLYTPALLAHI